MLVPSRPLLASLFALVALSSQVGCGKVDRDDGNNPDGEAGAGSDSGTGGSTAHGGKPGKGGSTASGAG